IVPQKVRRTTNRYSVYPCSEAPIARYMLVDARHEANERRVMRRNERNAGVHHAGGNLSGRVGPAKLVDQPDMTEGMAAVLAPHTERLVAQHQARTVAHGQEQRAIELGRGIFLDDALDRDRLTD